MDDMVKKIQRGQANQPAEIPSEETIAELQKELDVLLAEADKADNDGTDALYDKFKPLLERLAQRTALHTRHRIAIAAQAQAIKDPGQRALFILGRKILHELRTLNQKQ